jgi:hypothetical protein
MEKKKEIHPEKPVKREWSFNNRNFMVFAFFLLLSFIFWYLNSLGKDIDTNIRYPVRYINMPKDKGVAEDLPSRVYLYLNGSGYSILRMKATGNNSPLTIDFSKLNYRPTRNSSSANYYIVTSGLIQNLNSQIKSECRITSIKPDTLFFSFK